MGAFPAKIGQAPGTEGHGEDGPLGEQAADLLRLYDPARLQQGCTLPLLAWMRDHAPDTLARARHAVSYKDFLRFRLTGEIAADETEASVAPGDTHARAFSPRMLSLFGLEAQAFLLGPVRPSEARAGEVTQQAAQATAINT